ncbi:MAG: hypothetical protein J5525_09165 [Lachnospiraceae bacterium]|nr:hypothetical protein [Lachnospiraceae bacterium]
MKAVKQLTGDDKPVLLLGNGIARAFEGDSWRKIIEKTIKEFQCEYSYEEIKELPSTFQITAATKNDVLSAMKILSNELCSLELSKEYYTFLCEYIVESPITDIISTNYTYEVEKAIKPSYSTSPQNQSRLKTKEGTKRENQMMLYRYNLLNEGEYEKRIWHIHGEACTAKTMVMSQYYYGYKISAIQDYLKANMSYYKACENRGEKPVVKSWIDLFLLRDIYIVGFGMDFSESDFWWLTCYKRLYFPHTKIYSFEPNLIYGDSKEIMANVYGIELKRKDEVVTNDEFKQFYKEVFREIKASV